MSFFYSFFSARVLKYARLQTMIIQKNIMCAYQCGRFFSRFFVGLLLVWFCIPGKVWAQQPTAEGGATSSTTSSTDCYSLFGDRGTCVTTGSCAAGSVISGGVCSPGMECCNAAGAPGETSSTGTPSGGACSDRLSPGDPPSFGSCASIASCSGSGTIVGGASTCATGLICCIGMATGTAGTGSIPTGGGGSTSAGGGTTGGGLFPSTGFGSGTGSSCPAGTILERGICIPTGTGLSRGDTTSTFFSLGFLTFSIPFICTLGPVACVLATFMNWILSIIGFIAIISFVIAGLQYLLAFGEPKEIEKAKTHVKWAIVGVIVALSGMVVIYAVDSLLRGFSRF